MKELKRSSLVAEIKQRSKWAEQLQKDVLKINTILKKENEKIRKLKEELSNDKRKNGKMVGKKR